MRLFISLLAAVLAALAVTGAVLLMLPGEKLARLAADQIEAQTGRKLAFDGKVQVMLWPALGVKADGVTLSNADWAGPEPLLAAQRLTIGVAAADLLSGNVRVTEVSAILPTLNLAVNEAGTGNWEFAPAAEPATTAPEAPVGSSSDWAFSIDTVNLTGAALRYAAPGQETVEIRNADLLLKWPDPAGLANISLTLRPAGEPVQIEAEVGSFAAFLSGQVASAGVSVAAPGGKLRFDGHAGLSGEASGRVTVDAKDTARMAAAAGLAGLDLPQGLGRVASAGADATYTSDGRLSLRDMALDLDGNQLQGAADVIFGDVPQVTARLTGGDIDFSGLAAGSESAAGGGSAAGEGSGSGGWSSEPIDASALALANGTVDLAVNSLKAGGISLDASRLSLSLDRSRAVLKLMPAAAFGGAVQGQLVVNNRNGLSVGGKLNFNGIQLERALGETAGYDRFRGEALGELEYLGSGSSMDAIMRSLSGKGWLEVGRGTFTGFDLEELMRSGSGNGGSTVFDQLTGSYTVEGGNLSNQDLLVTLKGVRAEGKGRVGLGARDLDYLFTPTVLRGNGGEGLSIPVAIKGSWDDPKIRPDLKQALQPEIDAAEDQAKEELRRKLSEELETEVTEEVDVNEAIRDRIEQQAKEQLLRLLQGD